MTDLLVTLALNAAFWGGMAALVGRRIRDRLDRVLATAIAGLSVIVVWLECLGLAGWINRWSLAVLCVGAGVAGLRARRRTREVAIASRVTNPRLVSWHAAPALASLVLGLGAALAALVVGLLLPVEPISDAPIYHLPFAAQWWKSGTLTIVPTPFGDVGASYYPANGDLWLAWLLLLDPSGVLVKVGQWPFMALSAVALSGLGRLTRASWTTAVFPAALWVSLPIVLAQSTIANIDLIWTACYLAAVYFLLRWLDDRSASPDLLLLFGLASGLVIGAKTVGALFVALLLLAAFVGLRGRARSSRHVLVLVCALIVPSAYWYLRNWWVTGNPLYPVQLSVFGFTLADGWYRESAMDVSAYHLPAAAWKTLLGRLPLVAGPLGVALALTGLVTGLTQIRRASRDSRSRALIMCAALAAAQLVIYWVVVPYNTQERFLSPALGLALVPLVALAEGRVAVKAALCLASVWQVVFLVTGSYGSIAAALARQGEQPLSSFYPQSGFATSLSPGWEILERTSRPGGSRVAYAGTNLPYYLFGVGLRNDVRYVNVNARPDWLPHDYHRDRIRTGDRRLSEDPYPQWDRTAFDFDAWLANLRRHEIELLFVARENRHGRLEKYPNLVPAFPIERAWADAHPEHFEDLGPFEYAPGTIPWVRVYRLSRPQ